MSNESVLGALLDTLVPASEDGRMPSASEVGFDAFLVTQGEAVAPALQAILAQLGDDFATLSAEARHEKVTELSASEPALFAGLLAQVYDCYYQDDRVRSAIGVVQGPVFPQGNEVARGNLTMLDPVIENCDQYRYREP
ncbi:MAG: gluconate 2-dehydrogenase subunit 3 family protein [bacterium]|nr:gluconate 2-dehydrogenase subunit 3 family protein [bacterium]MCP5069213.1 gluconate 2-dehydrogenase subunit 3 family protein [bacterium]